MMTKCFRRAWKCTPRQGAGITFNIELSVSSSSVSDEADSSPTKLPASSQDELSLRRVRVEEEAEVKLGTINEEGEAKDLKGRLSKPIEDERVRRSEGRNGEGGGSNSVVVDIESLNNGSGLIPPRDSCTSDSSLSSPTSPMMYPRTMLEGRFCVMCRINSFLPYQGALLSLDI
jgi:hypothetical protein